MSIELAIKISQMGKFEDIPPHEMANANIMPKTGFATDYLNVFNEAVMLFSLLGDMPDMVEELEAWEFLNYEEHFKRSNFQAKELAISVYHTIPNERKEPFDTMAQDLGDMIKSSIEEVKDILRLGGDVSSYATETCFALQSMIMVLDGMIHGRMYESAQDDVDALFD